MSKSLKRLFLLLLVLAPMFLVASCAPNANPDKAKEALEENGYLAGKSLDGYEEFGGLETVVSGTKMNGLKIEIIMILYFESSKAASKVWEESGEELKKELKEYEDIVAKKSGKMIYIGTKQAVKDAR